MRIELLGPSGIGKTTALTLAEQLRRDDACWIGPATVDPLIAKSLPDQRFVMDELLPRAFLDTCLAIAAEAQMLPSQKFRFLEIFHRTCRQAAGVMQMNMDRAIVHDEMLLHRSFSFLFMASDFERSAPRFFDNAPLPDAAIIATAPLPVLIERAAARPARANCYYGMEGSVWHAALARTLTLADIAAERLDRRGVKVRILNTEGPAADASARLSAMIEELCQS